MRIPVTGSLSDWLPPLKKTNTSPYELNPRNIGTSKTLKSPKTVSNAEDYRAARKAIAARPKAKPAPKKSSGGSGGGSNLGGFGGDLGALAGLGGGGSSNPYLDVINSLKDEKTFDDYMAEANKIYKPSLDFIKGQETAATNRAGQYDKDLAGMYEALVGNINAQQPVIAQNYNDAISGQNQITGNAKQAVGNNYADSQAQQMAMLRQLGVEAAAPETLQTGQDSQAFFQSLLDSQGAGYNNYLNSQKVASQDFNTAQSNIAAQTGTNARADLKSQLQDILAQYGSQEADLKTQINQQAASMQSGAASALQDQAKMLMDAIRYNNGDQLDMAKFQQSAQNDAATQAWHNAQLQAQIEKNRADAELGAAKLAMPKSSSTKPDVWTQVAAMANQAYGGNSTAAQNAIKALQGTIAAYNPQYGEKPSLGSFIQTLLSRVSPTGRPTGGGDTGQLTQLATFLYQQLYG